MNTYIAMLMACMACSDGARRPNYQYYALAAQPAETPTYTTGGMPGPRALAVGQVTMPTYLESESIASRPDSEHVVYSRTDRWAEPLDDAFARALRENLAMRLAPNGIEVEAKGRMPTYNLQVDVLRFERTSPDHVELWARWTLRSRNGVIDDGETHVQVPMARANTKEMAASLSEAVARMAIEVADRVQRADQVALRERR